MGVKEHGSSVGICLYAWLDGESAGISRSGGVLAMRKLSVCQDKAWLNHRIMESQNPLRFGWKGP